MSVDNIRSVIDLDQPDEIVEAARRAMEKTLPKSKNIYQRVYDQFINWMKKHNTKSLSETVLLAYFENLSQKINSASMYAKYSMLKSEIDAKHGVDISQYKELKKFLKRSHVNYKSKQAETLTHKEVVSFLLNAPDDEFISIKVIFVNQISCSNNIKAYQ